MLLHVLMGQARLHLSGTQAQDASQGWTIQSRTVKLDERSHSAMLRGPVNLDKRRSHEAHLPEPDTPLIGEQALAPERCDYSKRAPHSLPLLAKFALLASENLVIPSMISEGLSIARFYFGS